MGFFSSNYVVSDQFLGFFAGYSVWFGNSLCVRIGYPASAFIGNRYVVNYAIACSVAVRPGGEALRFFLFRPKEGVCDEDVIVSTAFGGGVPHIACVSFRCGGPFSYDFSIAPWLSAYLSIVIGGPYYELFFLFGIVFV